MNAKRLSRDMKLNTDPASSLWRNAPSVSFERGPRNEPVPLNRTQVLARWTPQALYFLFECPYEQLYLKPSPDTVHETNLLWDYDVAEIFVGADFEKIWQYRELQVSPQGEWVDLDIDRKEPKPEGGWRWSSGYEHAARIDEAHKIWYAAFRIPVKSITEKPAAPGTEYRINLYRIEGPEPHRKYICWRPTGSPSYHVPEAFGLLRLEE
ncbi:MAG: carbohydrate-binding family 9-like protein [Bryobacteraceae bacterium]|nr:carbohydrate-binding family 9-like protein [Bryobacteraceae bacterium]